MVLLSEIQNADMLSRLPLVVLKNRNNGTQKSDVSAGHVHSSDVQAARASVAVQAHGKIAQARFWTFKV